MLTDTEIAVGVHYLVHLDEKDLGDFASCEGLGVEVVLESREEGGNNGFIWQFPTQAQVPEHQADAAGEQGDRRQDRATGSSPPSRASRAAPGTSRRGRPTSQTVATYDLHDVIPVRWTGPSLNADQPKVLMETLEIAHHGFVKHRDSKY